MHPCYFFYKNTCKIRCTVWPESLWVSDCTPQGIRVSLVWYQLLTCHLSGRAAKGNILMLWTVWTDWWPYSNFSQITYPADSCLEKLSRWCKDVNPSCLSEVHCNSKIQFTAATSLISTQHHRKNSCKGFFQKAAVVNSICIHTPVCMCIYVCMYIVEAAKHIINEV